MQTPAVALNIGADVAKRSSASGRFREIQLVGARPLGSLPPLSPE
jgi:hypothetical protein